jgi:multidrug efflux pump subunit AcrB
MNLGRLSINQPILAMVLSIVLLIVGALAYTTLPVSEYPQVVPPTVVVTTQYPGASAQTVSDTVAAPIEQQINGVEDMLYLYSQATSNGQLTITGHLQARHRPRQGAGAGAEPRRDRAAATAGRGAAQRRRHPQELARHPDGRVHAVARRQLRPALHLQLRAAPGPRPAAAASTASATSRSSARATIRCGCGSIPDRIANLGLTSTEVLAAIRAQNVQIAGGQIAEPPIADRAFQPTSVHRAPEGPEAVRGHPDQGRLDGRTVRLRDVARIELGALAYSTNSFLLRKSAVAMLVTQRPGSNALATAKTSPTR